MVMGGKLNKCMERESDEVGVFWWKTMRGECISDIFFFFSSRRRHTRLVSDWSSDVCSSDLPLSYTHIRLALIVINTVWTC